LGLFNDDFSAGLVIVSNGGITVKDELKKDVEGAGSDLHQGDITAQRLPGGTEENEQRTTDNEQRTTDNGKLQLRDPASWMRLPKYKTAVSITLLQNFVLNVLQRKKSIVFDLMSPSST
jgi:hypothetical protein